MSNRQYLFPGISSSLHKLTQKQQNHHYLECNKSKVLKAVETKGPENVEKQLNHHYLDCNTSKVLKVVEKKGLENVEKQQNHHYLDYNKSKVLKALEMKGTENVYFFTSVSNETFRVPTDDRYLAKWGGFSQFMNSKTSKVRYLRKMSHVVARGTNGNCTKTLDVLAWLMGQVNTKQGTLMIAYGQLIHIYREKDFFTSRGNYLDDDFDMWASLETVVHLGRLEAEIFLRFGWTVRVFVNSDDYVVFLQIMASCGHVPVQAAAKVKSNQPAIEIYPLPPIHTGKHLRTVKDLWQGSRFPESMLYPPQHIRFNSTGTSLPLHLQVPHKAIHVLSCLYGNWRAFSQKHAALGVGCKQ